MIASLGLTFLQSARITISNLILRACEIILVILIVSLFLIGLMMSSVSMVSYLIIIITGMLIYTVHCDTYDGSSEHDDYVSLYHHPYIELQKCKYMYTRYKLSKVVGIFKLCAYQI